MKDRSGFYPSLPPLKWGGKGHRWWGKVAIVSLLLIFMVGCAGLQFKVKVENKLGIAKEVGYQLMTRVLKELPEGETKEKLKANTEIEFAVIRKDLDNEELPINASYLKAKLYTWIDRATKELGLIEGEDARLIMKTQDFFALEGGYEATPEQRVIGMAFCDGVLEAITSKL